MSLTLNAKIASDVQKLAYGVDVELFDIITASTGDTNGPYYISNNVTTSGTVVKLNGVSYTPIDFRFRGYGMDTEGKFARPTFEISNALRAFAALVNEYDGLVGATVIRRKTKAEYLDDGDEADSIAQYPTATYLVSRIVEYNKFNIKWELVADIDREDKRLPGRQAWKDFCSFNYRIYVDGAFNYDNVHDCPYTATVSGSYFKRDGTATDDPGEDVCNKLLTTGCKARFTSGTIPFGGFPGMAETRL